MNQDKIGRFILELRKQKGMTQKELAEQIGVSDKTISKWECGTSIPDISYLESLCHSLEISVNELLSGERLSKESYSEKAEENIMALMKENESNKKGDFTRIFFGMVLVMMAFGILVFGCNRGVRILYYYIDFIAAFVLALFCIGIVLLSGKQTKQGIWSCLQKIAIPSGVLIMLFELIIILGSLDDISALGPNLAVCILTLLYGIGIYLTATVLTLRKKQE